MTGLILDSGAFVAVDRDDHAMLVRLRVAQENGVALRTTAMVIAEVWRDPDGRQEQLARLLRSIDVRAVDLDLARAAGVLTGRAGTDDSIDATVVLIAETGDTIVTSDPSDIRRLIGAAGKRVAIIPC